MDSRLAPCRVSSQQFRHASRASSQERCFLMHLRSTCLRIGAPLAVTVLIGCQAAPSAAGPTPALAPTVLPQPTPVSALPSGEQVTLGPVKDQMVLVDQVGYLPALPKV